MLKITPNLLFKRNCNEAMALYKEAFGAEVKLKILFSEANPQDFQYKNEDEKNCVFYSEVMIENQKIIMADDSNEVLDWEDQGKVSRTSLMNLLVEFASEEKLQAAYKVLADGATILTPLGSTTYCTAYVMLVDKFGKNWELMSGYEG